MSEKATEIQIYYADDDPDDVFFFTNAIGEIESNFNVHSFSSGIALIEKLKTARLLPDVIFLDVNMPMKNGLECLKEIRKHSEWDSIPVYIISTSSADIFRERAIECGALSYIQKPLTYLELKEKLNEAIMQALYV